jgi:hypothetical protein
MPPRSLWSATSGRPNRIAAYGHAERNLALLRQLEAETRQLLESLDQPDPDQSAWLQEVTGKEEGSGNG